MKIKGHKEVEMFVTTSLSVKDSNLHQNCHASASANCNAEPQDDLQATNVTQVQNKEMKMCKTIPTFILLFTGYCVKNMRVAATESEAESRTSVSLVSNSTQSFSTDTQTFQLTTTSSYLLDSETGIADSSTAISNASILVAGLSIFFVLFFLCASLGVWSARKLSKRDSFDVTPAAPSGEAQVTLRTSRHENR